jgi:carboxyl-terminal processing protease
MGLFNRKKGDKPDLANNNDRRGTFRFKSFSLGILTGVIASFLVCAISFNLYYNDMPLSAVFSKNTQGSGKSQSETAGENCTDLSGQETEQIKIDAKKDIIKSYINKYFLYDDDVNDDDYVQAQYKAMLDILGDPYSCYYTPEEYKKILEMNDGSYVGIGAMVAQNEQSGAITIVNTFPDSPASKAGLKSGDIIYKVDGRQVTGMSIDIVITEIKGDSDTDVNITIIRSGEVEPLDFKITRKKIDFQTVTYKKLTEDGQKIGYISISEFDTVTVKQFTQALKELDEWGAQGLVFDLRNNPGGLVDSVTDILDELLPEGVLVYMEDKNGNRTDQYTSDDTYVDAPMTVLINGSSASAAEIFAGAMKDFGAAKIIGTTSYGKGIVQQVFPLSDGSAVKLTVEKYFTPSGVCIHGTGITPDIEVELSDEVLDDYSFEKDNQIETAIDTVLDEIGK